MGDYFSAEGYIMLDNENFPLSLLHFCNLSFQKFEISHPHAKYQESWSNASLRPLYFFAFYWLEFCFDAFQKHFPCHIYIKKLTNTSTTPADADLAAILHIEVC